MKTKIKKALVKLLLKLLNNLENGNFYWISRDENVNLIDEFKVHDINIKIKIDSSLLDIATSSNKYKKSQWQAIKKEMIVDQLKNELLRNNLIENCSVERDGAGYFLRYEFKILK